MRALFTLVHRWFGLVIAAFIFLTGVTGAVISWDHELDDLLNPHLMHVDSRGAAIPATALVRQIEARDPRVRVTYFPLAAEPGSLSFFVVPRVDPASGRPYELDYNQIFLDPVTGAELGTRKWGQVWPVSSETFVSFLYKFHYSLHIPEMWGIDEWGVWFLGIIAVIWTVDCFIGFYLTLPLRRERRATRAASVQRQLDRSWWSRWKPAWAIKWSGSGYRINFDIHRAFGLWTWALLFILAFTGFSLNLYGEVFYPAMSKISQVTPTPFDTRSPQPRHQPIEPAISREQAIALAEAEAARRGWTVPVGALAYAPAYGFYSPAFPARRRPWQCRGRPGAAVYRRHDRRAAGRAHPLAGHGGRPVRAGAVPAAFGPHPRPARAHRHLGDGAGGRRAVGHRRGDLVPQTCRPHPPAPQGRHPGAGRRRQHAGGGVRQPGQCNRGRDGADQAGQCDDKLIIVRICIPIWIRRLCTGKTTGWNST